MQMTNVTEQILGFRKFLLDSWADLDQLMNNHDWENDDAFIDEWMQVNWEFLVERQLLKKNGVLSPFALFYNKKRVTNTLTGNKYLIVCKPKHGNFFTDDKTEKKISSEQNLILRTFLKKVDTSYGLYPPFDYAGVVSEDKKNFFYFFVNDIEFFMKKEEDVKT